MFNYRRCWVIWSVVIRWPHICWYVTKEGSSCHECHTFHIWTQVKYGKCTVLLLSDWWFQHLENGLYLLKKVPYQWRGETRPFGVKLS